ncbi:hypothetical protein ACFQX4_21435 [Roseomonas sp. GCM10028921]
MRRLLSFFGRLRGRVLAAVLFVTFDVITILPAAAGGYVIKRAADINVFPRTDMLPDPLIEGLLGRFRHLVRSHL